MSWGALTPTQVPSGDEVNDGIVASSLPAGPASPTLSFGSTDPEAGDTATLSWTNVGGSVGLIREVEWQRWISGTGWVTQNPMTQHDSPAAGADRMTSDWNSGDGIRARVRYRPEANGLIGDGVVGGTAIPSGSALNSGLVLTSSFTATVQVPKGEIIAATPTVGDWGGFSHEIFLD